MNGHSSRLLVVTWLVYVIYLKDASADDTKIKEVYPRFGGLNGQVRLTIPGSNFALNQFNYGEDVGNAVNLIRGSESYPCDVLKDATTRNQIVCYTPPLPEGSYQVRVIVNGEPVPVEYHCRPQFPNDYRCSFKPREAYTPIVETVTPQSGPPGTIVQFCGIIFTDLIDSTNETGTNNKTERIIRSYIGGNVCELKPDNFKDEIYGVWLESETSNRGCVRCKIAGTYIASTNGSFIVNGPYGRSMARNKNEEKNVYRISAKNKKYMFQTYAVVDEITPHIGAATGGTLVTIKGNYFDDTDAPLKVLIDGSDCDVVSMDKNMIVCKSPKSQPVRSGNMYPGSRGLTMEIWNGISYKKGDIDKVQKLTPEDGDYSSVAHDETYFFLKSGLEKASLQFKGLFIPPTSGNYSFRIRSASASALWFSKDHNNPADKTKIAYCSQSCGSSWKELDSQISSPVNLEGGQSYYLESYTSNRGVAMSLQVGVDTDQTVFVESQTKSARNEVQRIAITSPMKYETQKLTLNNWSKQKQINEVQDVTVTSGSGVVANYRMCLDNVCTAPISLDATPAIMKDALQQLPSIKPDKVSVKRVSITDGFTYTVTFLSDRGDFPNLDYEIEPAEADVTIKVTEKTKGKSSLESFVLEMDGIPSAPISSTATESALRAGIMSMFEYKCPSSITQGIGFEQDSEANTWGLPVTNVEPFCGRTSLKNPSFLFQSSEVFPEINLQKSPWLCFAYKGQFSLKLSFSFVENGESHFKDRGYQPNLESGSGWHYICVEIYSVVTEQNPQADPALFLLASCTVLKLGAADIYVDDIAFNENPVPDFEDVLKQRMSAAHPRDYIIEDVQVKKIDKYEYDITFYVYKCGNNLPLLAARYITTTKEESKDVAVYSHSNWDKNANIRVERTVAGSKGVTGSFSLTWGSETVPNIKADVEAEGLVGSIQAQTSLGKVRVTRTGMCSGYTWDIEFVESGGTKPLPTVTSNLSGKGANIEASRVQKGGLFSAIISGDMLKPIYDKPQVTVYVNNIPSSCSGSCSYEWQASYNPEVASVSPSSGSSVEKTVITISGSNLEAIMGNEDPTTVTIGGVSCNIKSQTASEIKCVVGAGPVGTYDVEVYVQGKGVGVPSGTDLTFTYNGAINSIKPDTGSPGGGISMSINGYGFDEKSTVTVGGENCPVTKVTGTQIVCTVPSKVNGASDSAAVAVLHPEGNLDSTISYTYDSSLTPTISALSFTSLSVTGNMELEMSGSNLGKKQPSTAKVYVGSTEVKVKSWSRTKIVAKLPPHEPGGFPVAVFLGKSGNADTSALSVPHITYQLEVTSVFPQKGSIFGGTKLTISGKGFGTNATEVEVDVSNYAANTSCEVTDIEDTQILCNIGDGGRTHVVDNFGFHPDFGSGFAWNPQTINIKAGDTVSWRWSAPVGVTDIAYKVQQTPSPSDGYDGTGFASASSSPRGTFSYKFSEKGTYYYTSGAVDTKEERIMRGVVKVADETAHSEVLSVKRSGIEALQDTNSGVRDPKDSSTCSPVLSPLTGCSETEPDAKDKSKFSFKFLKCYSPRVTKISPAEGVDSTVITIKGKGFDSDACKNKVMIGENECPVTSSTETEIKCKPDHGNKLMSGVLHEVSVCIWNRGCAIVEPMAPAMRSFKLIPKISSLSPIQGSAVGGTSLTISGTGFSGEDKFTEITILGKPCEIKEFSYTEIVCETSDSGRNNAKGPVVMQFNTYEGTETAECPNGCDFSYAKDVTPMVASVSPTTISAGNTVMTIIGTNFGSTLEDVNIFIADMKYAAASVTPTEITLMVDGLPFGTHFPKVCITGVGKASSQVTVESEKAMTAISPTSGGMNGGVKMTISGNGFTDNVRVFIARVRTEVISISPSEVVVLTPALKEPGGMVIVRTEIKDSDWPGSQRFTVAQDNTPLVKSSAVSGNSLTLMGSGFSPVPADNEVHVGNLDCVVSTSSEAELTCAIPTLSAGNYDLPLTVKDKGFATSDATLHIDLIVTSISPSSGSFGGGQAVSISGSGFNPKEAVVKICDNICELKDDGNSGPALVCETPANAGSGTVVCDVAVEVNGETGLLPAAYTYDSSKTADITDVNPRRAGTGGGTRVTIKGTGFSSSKRENVVSIAGQICPVKSCSETQIICETEPSHQTAVTRIRVAVRDQGIAIQEHAGFYYIDVWSSVWTWDRESPPVEGDMVVITKGQTILLDVDTPVFVMLLIQGGTLIFDDERDIHLQAKNILITDGGRLQIGTEEEPYQHQAQITMHGDLRSPELPIYGAKTLALREGTLDMHGRPVAVTWTRLKATAKASDTEVKLTVPVNWQVGDSIVLPTTGDRHSQAENEVGTIAAISDDGLTLTLKDPLKHTHIVETVTVNGRTIVMAGEVGLLTHNIKFKGSDDTQWHDKIEACPEGFDSREFSTQTCFQGLHGEEMGNDQFGGAIMAHAVRPDEDLVKIRLENVEFNYVGQAFKLGRYPVHIHLNGDMNGSYVRGCSLHKTFNRAVNIHGSHNFLVEFNVVYDAMGGAFFLEDGIETGNIFQYNFLAFVQASSSLQNEDLTPSGLWVTNPNNTVRHNAVAGGSHMGYWYRMHEHTDGPSFDPNICPQKVPLGEFYNNTAHSLGWFGLWVFRTYTPTIDGKCNSTHWFPATFRNLLAWNCGKGAEWVNVGIIQFVDFTVIGNEEAGIELKLQYTDPDYRFNFESGPLIKNALIVGHTPSMDSDYCTHSSIIVPYGMGVAVDGTVIANCDRPACRAFYGTKIHCFCEDNCGGYSVHFRNMTFIDCPNKGHFRWKHDAAYVDEDGSLTDSKKSAVVLPTTPAMPPECKHSEEFSRGVPASVCPGGIKVIRFAFNQPDPPSLLGNDAILTNKYGSMSAPFGKKRSTNPHGWQEILFSRMEYNLEFANSEALTNISYKGLFQNVEDGEWVIICHKLATKPDMFELEPGKPLPLSPQELSYDRNENGDWYYYEQEEKLCYLISSKDQPDQNGGSPNRKKRRVNRPIKDRYVAVHAYKCIAGATCLTPQDVNTLPPAANRPKDAVMWSDASAWTKLGYVGIPKANDDVTIPEGTWMVLDTDPNPLHYLTITGTLEVDPDSRNDFTLSAEVILIKGRLIAGFEDQRFAGDLTLELRGEESTQDFEYDSDTMGPPIGKKAIAVFGALELRGVEPEIKWTKLKGTANAGDKFITLETAVDWGVGQKIVLAPTSYDPWQTETFEIKSISEDRKTLSVNGSLQYTHLGETYDVPGKEGETYTMAAHVGLLSRNIRIEGASYPNIETESLGGRVLCATLKDIKLEYTGFCHLDNVEFIRTGQFGYNSLSDSRYSVTYMNVGRVSDALPSVVKSCTFHNGFWSAVGVIGTDNLNITDNVFHHTVGSAILIANKINYVTIERNLVVLMVNPSTYLMRTDKKLHWDGGIDVLNAAYAVLRNNVVAGSESTGINMYRRACPEDLLGKKDHWHGNEIYCALVGVDLYDEDKTMSCAYAPYFTIWRCSDYGMYFNTYSNVKVESATLVDNQVGMLAVIIGPNSEMHRREDHTVKVENSLIVGTSPDFDCQLDVVDKKGKNAMASKTSSSWKGRPDKGGRVGLSMSSFTATTNKAPNMKLDCIENSPAIGGATKLKNVHFVSFKKNKCGLHDTAIMPVRLNEDFVHPLQLSGTSHGDVDHDHWFFIRRPNLEMIIPVVCVDMPCDAMNQVLIADTDGGLLGSPGYVISQAEYQWDRDQRYGIGDYRIPKVALTDSDGKRLNVEDVVPNKGLYRTDECKYVSDWQAYECHDTDYRIMVIESLDPDAQTRRISPIAVMADSYVELLNGPQDHGWCSGYSCQKRLSTFHTVVPLIDKPVKVFTTGVQPQKLRLHLLNSANRDGIVVGVYYSSPQRLDVYQGKNYVVPINAALDENAQLTFTEPDFDDQFMPKPTSPAGSNFFDTKYNMLYVTVRGGSDYVDIQVSPIVRLKLKMAPMTSDEFFGENIIQNLAVLLGIDPSKIRITTIVREQQPSRRKRDIWESLFGHRFRRSTEEMITEVEFEIAEPIQTELPSEENGTGVNDTYTEEGRNELIAAAGNLSYELQTGDLGSKLGINIVGASLEEPQPPPTDPRWAEKLEEKQALATDGNEVPILRPDHMEIVVTPSGATAGNVFTQPPSIRMLTASNEVVPSLGTTANPWKVEASLKSGTGTAGATLHGDKVLPFAEGWANFTNLAISAPGEGYEIDFKIIHPDPTSVASISAGPFNVADAASSAPESGELPSEIEEDQELQVHVKMADAITGEDFINIEMTVVIRFDEE